MRKHQMNQIASEPRGSAGAFTRVDAQRWVGVGLMLLLSALAMLNTVRTEFGLWRAEVLQVDEQFFATCATRGLATGTQSAARPGGRASIMPRASVAGAGGASPKRELVER